jgi:hypothetical protein
MTKLLERLQEYEPHQLEVEKAMEWILANTEMRKTINKKHSSYGLKHVAEKWAKCYISNDALIEAMIRCGYSAQQCSPASPNYFFNIKTLRSQYGNA